MDRHLDRDTDQETRGAALRLLLEVCPEEPLRWFFVEVETQRLCCVEDGKIVRSYGVSTAAAGVDAREGSFGTPPGVHRIDRKIGDGMDVGTWFESREPVGRWTPGEAAGDEDLVLSRILTLEGCQEGVNRGQGIDSLARFIYIHGTNHEDGIGRPLSHGCIRMSNTDVIHLFDRVEEGDHVVVV